VRVVEPEVAPAAELRRDPEVQADRLGMADVEVAVGLGREAGDGRRDATGGDVGGDDLADEVAPLGRGWGLGDHARLLRPGREESQLTPTGAPHSPRELAGAPGFEPGTF